jgi:small basic protein (TIGR04137 family)
MSQHPSLRSSDKDKKHRSVLKRYERIKTLQDKEKWDEKKDSVFGLPKVKVTRFKIKKEKAVVAEGTETAEGAAAGAAPAAPGKEALKPAGKTPAAGAKVPAADAKKEAKK